MDENKFFITSDNYNSCLYSRNTIQLMKLDKIFINLLQDYKYETFTIPTIIEEGILRKCGYFSSFPHQLNIVSSFNKIQLNNIAVNEKVTKENISDDVKYLTPAACLHIYPMLENIKDMSELIITTKAKVYRNEAEYENLIRMREFNVREVVFAGDANFVQTNLEKLKKAALNIALKINKGSFIEKAIDNFYPSKKNKMKEKIQKATNQKQELIIPIKNKNIAVASFNYHHFHFSQAFNFDNNNKIVTGCIGFGLERWLAACLEYNKFIDNE